MEGTLIFLSSKNGSFKHYATTQENQFYNYCNSDGFAFGSEYIIFINFSSPYFGLFVSQDLHSGYSKPCKTYNNECLTLTEHFKIKKIEAWILQV